MPCVEMPIEPGILLPRLWKADPNVARNMLRTKFEPIYTEHVVSLVVSSELKDVEMTHS